MTLDAQPCVRRWGGGRQSHTQPNPYWFLNLRHPVSTAVLAYLPVAVRRPRHRKREGAEDERGERSQGIGPQRQDRVPGPRGGKAGRRGHPAAGRASGQGDSCGAFKRRPARPRGSQQPSTVLKACIQQRDACCHWGRRNEVA